MSDTGSAANAAQKQSDEAFYGHRALDDFGVPRTEPCFRGPYKLSGRIRWLRSTLVIEANLERQRRIEAERRVDELEDALGRARAHVDDALFCLAEGGPRKRVRTDTAIDRLMKASAELSPRTAGSEATEERNHA